MGRKNLNGADAKSIRVPKIVQEVWKTPDGRAAIMNTVMFHKNTPKIPTLNQVLGFQENITPIVDDDDI